MMTRKRLASGSIDRILQRKRCNHQSHQWTPQVSGWIHRQVGKVTQAIHGVLCYLLEKILMTPVGIQVVCQILEGEEVDEDDLPQSLRMESHRPIQVLEPENPRISPVEILGQDPKQVKEAQSPPLPPPRRSPTPPDPSPIPEREDHRRMDPHSQ
ncbi:hypothetical protein [Kwatta virus]|uniref:Uncharacterized protein n=1 Tax=Kwatta virus TaxID=1272945 RepID=A0A0D3R0X3_9RHAB|nr:hypothetical protein KM623_gp3 [Kwatta virus]AJR28294.1 hypothetical protein [Kwatta virus]